MSLGAGSEIGADCRLLRSVVGPGCHLSDGVTLEDTVLGPGCRLGERVSARRALLGAGVQLAPGVELAPGCVLGPGVRVERAGRLPAGTLLTAQPPEDEFGDGDTIGEEGRGEGHMMEVGCRVRLNFLFNSAQSQKVLI